FWRTSRATTTPGPKAASSPSPTARSRISSSILLPFSIAEAEGRMADVTLPFSSAAQLGRMLKKRELSSVELTKLYLDALESRGQALNAVATVTRDLALKQAAQADKEIKAAQVRGPLHGVPYGAKDLLATKGIPTQWGSPAHKGQMFDYD